MSKKGLQGSRSNGKFRTALTTATSVGIMVLSQMSVADSQRCRFVGVNTDPENAVVFSVTDMDGNLNSTDPIKPGAEVVIDMPSGATVLIGATPVKDLGEAVTSNDYHYAGLYTYKGSAIQTANQISAVYPSDFDLN